MRAAQRAEALGYHSALGGRPAAVRRSRRARRTRPPPTGSLPEYFKRSMDPVEALTFAAAHTRRITLGTSVLNMPFYNPVVLARRLATLDVLSGGRLRVGLGQAWSADELEAVGADPKARASRADEFIAVLKAMWGPDPVEFQGRHFRVARSIVGLKPVQAPHPPLYLAAYVAPALRRAATVCRRLAALGRAAPGYRPDGGPAPCARPPGGPRPGAPRGHLHGGRRPGDGDAARRSQARPSHRQRAQVRGDLGRLARRGRHGGDRLERRRDRRRLLSRASSASAKPRAERIAP